MRATGYAPIDWYLTRSARCAFGGRSAQIVEPPRDAARQRRHQVSVGARAVPALATLGQAFQLTRTIGSRSRSRASSTTSSRRTDRLGVNWTCTMDVGLRVVSWAIALEMARTCPALDDAWWVRAYTALFDHGVFIRNNLENTYEVTSNHFLSNCSASCSSAPYSRSRRRRRMDPRSRAEAIEHEMTVQVLADGADYESSIPYHRS